MSRWLCNISKDGDSTASLLNSVPVYNHLHQKKIKFLMSRRMFTCFSLCPLLTSSRQGDLANNGTSSSIKSEKPNDKKSPWKCLILCIFSNYAKYEVRPMSQNWSLNCLYDVGSQFILGQNHSYVLLCAMGDLLDLSVLLQQPNNISGFFFKFVGHCWYLLNQISTESLTKAILDVNNLICGPSLASCSPYSIVSDRFCLLPVTAQK